MSKQVLGNAKSLHACRRLQQGQVAGDSIVDGRCVERSTKFVGNARPLRFEWCVLSDARTRSQCEKVSTLASCHCVAALLLAQLSATS